jgi:hypothetical protein
VVLILFLACWFLLACVEPESVELAPDSVRARNDLLTACGQDRLAPVEPDDAELAQLVGWWREELALSLGYDDDVAARLITVSGVMYFDAYLVINAYYILDWLYLPFHTESAITDPKDQSAVRRTLADAIDDVGLGSLPSVTPIGLAQALDDLSQSCNLSLEDAACPPLSLVSGELWFSPPRSDGSESAPALRLRDGAVCCSGLAAGCQ